MTSESKCFEPGHSLATRHGAYATLQLQPRASELAEQLRVQMGDLYAPQFEAAVEAVAMIGARLERAHTALEEIDNAAQLVRLDQDYRSWMKQWLQALGTLGLTPAAAARLGLDVARTKNERRRAELAAHLARRRDVDGGDR